MKLKCKLIPKLNLEIKPYSSPERDAFDILGKQSLSFEKDKEYYGHIVKRMVAKSGSEFIEVQLECGLVFPIFTHHFKVVYTL